MANIGVNLPCATSMIYETSSGVCMPCCHNTTYNHDTSITAHLFYERLVLKKTPAFPSDQPFGVLVLSDRAPSDWYTITSTSLAAPSHRARPTAFTAPFGSWGPHWNQAHGLAAPRLVPEKCQISRDGEYTMLCSHRFSRPLDASRHQKEIGSSRCAVMMNGFCDHDPSRLPILTCLSHANGYKV